MTKARTRPLVGGGIAVLLLVLALAFAPKLHYVDQRPAVAFGDAYFSKLEQGRVDDAFAMYTDGFLHKRGEEWHKVVGDLNLQLGRVTDSKVIASQIAPVTLSDSTEIPCVLVQYQVTRTRIISDEKLTICPHQRGVQYGIAGHEITRSDNGQQFAAGLTIQQEPIFSTK